MDPELTELLIAAVGVEASLCRRADTRMEKDHSGLHGLFFLSVADDSSAQPLFKLCHNDITVM